MKKLSILSFVFTGICILFLADRNIIPADAAIVKDAYAKEASCVTSKCHATMGKDKFVHGPVALGECTSCHEPAGDHKFRALPTSKISKICYQCHEQKNAQKVVHPPVKAGQCTMCHDPHQSPNKFQLRAAGSDLCFFCHDKSIVGGKFIHGPAAVGSCSTCHAPHGSDNPKLLFATGNDVCFSCHTDKADDFKKAKFIHTPVRDACINCHSPHSGNYQYNLSEDGEKGLCLTCHYEKDEEIKAATTPHQALNRGRKCINCHDPHFGKYARQLKNQPAELCLSCHDRTYDDKDGKIANIKAILTNNSDHHGPIRQKDCSSCHNPHGSKNFRMLRQYFPPVFYAPYDPENYKLCFMCHEKTIASVERTTNLTNFRNGEQNLHYVHVHKAVKGRTCRACHDPHATNNPKHIRDEVPFGNWPLPTNYKKTESGGSCQPGCHQKFSYDRIKPVENRGAAR